MGRRYVGEALGHDGRRRIIKVADHVQGCGNCKNEIEPGEKYTQRPLVSAKPTCVDCVGFDEQPALFDDLSRPTERFGKPEPTHKKTGSYVGKDGEKRYRVECPEPKCNGRGYWYEKTKNATKVKKTCSTCGGYGYLWKKRKSAEVAESS